MKKQVQRSMLSVILAIVLSLTAIIPSFASTLEPPQQIIQEVSDTLQKKFQDKVFTQNFAQVVSFVKTVIAPHADFDKIALLVLGKHWKLATVNEQERFKEEFQTLIIRAYARAFVEYNNWQIRYLPAEITGDANKAIIKTQVMQSSVQPIDVNYRMLLEQGEWKVYDILINGMSLVTTYRSTFNAEIQKAGSLTRVIDDLSKRNTDALATHTSN